MMTTLIEKIVGELGDNRRWRQYTLKHADAEKGGSRS
jgi:hypothetical protein